MSKLRRVYLKGRTVDKLVTTVVHYIGEQTTSANAALCGRTPRGASEGWHDAPADARRHGLGQCSRCNRRAHIRRIASGGAQMTQPEAV